MAAAVRARSEAVSHASPAWTERMDLAWRAPSPAAGPAPAHDAPWTPSAASKAIPKQGEDRPVATSPQQAPPPRLDASLVDRVAADVMRRVERQLRIARERRGL
jgi:hypothetical protein